MSKRLNIGFLVDDLNNYFSNQACKGAELAARALDANLFIYPGHYIGKPDGRSEDIEFEYQYNSVFSLPNENNIDILYILLGTIGSRAEIDLQKKFLDDLPDVPKVTLFAEVEGYPSVTFDNKNGFGRALLHLIEKHGAKKIGLVSGPKTNKDARERLEAYTEVMAQNGLEVTDDLIVFGDFTEDSMDVTRKLLDNNPDLDAVMFANDLMALGAYKVFEERGIKVGRDILVAGFDDDIFSASMNPPLTTVEASSADLTYKAMLDAPDYISGNATGNISVDTYLVQRNSCGCGSLDVNGLKERFNLTDIVSEKRDCLGSLKDYMFGVFSEDEQALAVKESFEGFCDAYIDFINGDSNKELLELAFRRIVDSDILTYVGTEKLFNVLQTLQSVGSERLPGEIGTVTVDALFSEFYRLLSLKGLSLAGTHMSKRDKVSRLVNRQTGEIFTMGGRDTIPYDHLLEGLNSVGFEGSYLYMFQGNLKHPADEEWHCPKSVLLMAFADEYGVHMPQEEMMLLRTERLFANEFISQERRRTMTVFPLFVGEDLYGFIVNELDTSDLANVSLVAYQLSVSIKSLLMIEEQNRVKRELQTSLEQFMRDNSLLTKEARQDELTSLYNRRGFLEEARKAIADPLNRGKNAIICYADMDNLKMINDKFGHDDGDFALRETASILTDTFRNTDILGRIGGDEFVAFALVGSLDDYEKTLKERIENITRKHNEVTGKEYPVEMSVGICEFVCSDRADIFALLEEADEKLYVEKTEKKRLRGSYR